MLARTGVPTGDGRILAPAGGTSRTLPLPLSFQRTSSEGHAGSEVVGRIESIRFENGMVTATGSMLDSAEYSEVIEQLEAGVIGPSVDLDDIEYVMDENENLLLTQWRVAGATLVAIPAFADVSLTLDPLSAEPVEVSEPESMLNEWRGDPRYDKDGFLVASAALAEGLHNFELSPGSGAGNCVCGMDEHSFVHPHTYAAAEKGLGCVCSKEEEHPVHTPGLVASAATPALPPVAFFEPYEGDQPLTVTAEGRVFGLIAPWGQCHIGLPGCVTAPASQSQYSYFTTGWQETADAGGLPVGTLVAGPRHADPQMAFQAATQHYDDPGAAVARVVAGENKHGIWVSGWMIPTAAPEAVEVFKSSPVSGDWRRIGGSLELIAVCSVNAPGFPVARARVAFSGGHQRTLIGTFGITPVEVSEVTGATDAGAEARARWAWNQGRTERAA